jgi:hypothetical protein
MEAGSMNAPRLLTVMLAGMLALGVTACSSTQATVKQVVQQGVETTAAGPHNVVPANDAQNAVNQMNGQVQQTQQNANDVEQGTGSGN